MMHFRTLFRRGLSVQVDVTCRLGKGVQLDDYCRIGANTIVQDSAKIGRFTDIGSNCFIGSSSVVSHHVLIDSHTSIGHNSVIYPFAVLGYPPQDKKYQGELTSLEIGSHCRIRENVKIERGTNQRKKTTVGNGVLLMSNVYVGHDSMIEDQVVVANNTSLAGHVELQPFSVIGGHCAIHQFVRIGRGAMIGGMTVIRRDVPPYCLVTGTPPYIRCLNYRLIWRKVSNHKDRKWLRQYFDYLFHPTVNDDPNIYDRSHALLNECKKQLNSNIRSQILQQICEFVTEAHSSPRGLLSSHP
eukprot:jgi/Galph1/379/GphlegSOOS_G5105.1